jgi:hypothetical protein
VLHPAGTAPPATPGPAPGPPHPAPCSWSGRSTPPPGRAKPHAPPASREPAGAPPPPASQALTPPARHASLPGPSRPLSCRPARRSDNADSRDVNTKLRRVDSANSGNLGTAPMPGFGRARASRRRSWQKGSQLSRQHNPNSAAPHAIVVDGPPTTIKCGKRPIDHTGTAALSVASARYAGGTAPCDLVRRTDRNRPGGPVLYRRDSHLSAGARGAQGPRRPRRDTRTLRDRGRQPVRAMRPSVARPGRSRSLRPGSRKRDGTAGCDRRSGAQLAAR